MRLLSISLDRAILDPTSAAARRQALTYAGFEAVIVVVAPGIAQDVDLASGIRAKTFGGTSKFGAFMQAWAHLRTAEPCDVVTAQEPVFTGMLALRVARRLRCALHVQDHSGLFGRRAFGWRERVLRPVATFVLRKADRIRTVSQRGKRGLIAIGIPESNIDVIPIATDIARFSSVDQSPTLSNQLLCISRLEPEKGIGVLLSAFARLHKTHPEASLVIVGDGSQRMTLEKLARSFHVGDAVLFAGKADDVRPYLSRAALYVQPSYFEGWGMAVIEAAASGLPIVMTDVGCAGEVIKDGESGLVVPPGNAQALAAALERVYADAPLRNMLAAGARRAVKELPTPEDAAVAIRASLAAARRSV
ncbi:glycosyltransferase family 1 protein [Candidatus Uhrbacteria bacterium]|nr:MAG: glycosyltransferase family 1 protein [Candidatus Uhrbacteria bacterium]